MVARWQYRSTPPRCLHPMFDSKQCQRCGATAKAGWDFGGGSRQPAAGFFMTTETCFNFHSLTEYGDDGDACCRTSFVHLASPTSFST
ncbi:hypothetical protein ALC56_02086 [Trachymyrmex septentrionalis]|uniref:Uncharacterized protein n=1 Tax=Trachymyrmex septentrionalis TaxID=34720 RepID=A0A195FRX5_9HYME|nr:hypothetical protein ALC56_02086 [Trachymyrmex septentrionalis]